MNDRKQIRRNQLIGLIAGMLGGAMMAATWSYIPTTVGWGGAVMWGGVIGLGLGSLTQIEKLGYLITRSDNRMFNFLVGTSLPLLVIGVLLLVLK
ncbi:MAG: hypothetical protein HZC38_17670 [Chloroflexi bacterium]|nr:hypothetical protein [Chloroflexota bacterium]MBI5715230.1 hypothetical protein [Chloroflexota bacterium]